jgi:hypothetical protein
MRSSGLVHTAGSYYLLLGGGVRMYRLRLRKAEMVGDGIGRELLRCRRLGVSGWK